MDNNIRQNDNLTAGPYRCDWCGVVKVVPSLARDCEHRHLRDECQPDCTAAPNRDAAA